MILGGCFFNEIASRRYFCPSIVKYNPKTEVCKGGLSKIKNGPGAYKSRPSKARTKIKSQPLGPSPVSTGLTPFNWSFVPSLFR